MHLLFDSFAFCVTASGMADRIPGRVLSPELQDAGPSSSKPTCEPHRGRKLTTLSPNELWRLFTECHQLAMHNKINERNMWDLQLIDRMPELVKQQWEDEGTVDFQSASCGLDTSVEIYSKRVDNTHRIAMDSLSRTREGGASTGWESEPADWQKVKWKLRVPGCLCFHAPVLLLRHLPISAC